MKTTTSTPVAPIEKIRSYYRAQTVLNFKPSVADPLRRFDCNEDDIITFNVGGSTHHIQNSILQRKPKTLLAILAESKKADKKPIFIDRHPLAFADILNLYRDESLTMEDLPPHINFRVWNHELRYYDLIPPASLPQSQMVLVYHMPDSEENHLRYSLYVLLEVHQSSSVAKCWSVLTLLIIFLAVGSVIIESEYNTEFVDGAGYIDVEPPIAFFYFEWICTVFFTVEYLLRLFASNHRIRWLWRPLNVLDFLSVFPSYISFALSANTTAFSIIRMIRLARITRIFKIGRYLNGISVMGRTLAKSKDNLVLMLVFIILNAIFFSTIMYYAEHGRDNEGLDGKPAFSSIPKGLYWAIVTMTTLGYGDYVPQTAPGMVVAALCAMAGVIMIAMPLVIIGHNFREQYNHIKQTEADFQDAFKLQYETSKSQKESIREIKSRSSLKIDEDVPARMSSNINEVNEELEKLKPPKLRNESRITDQDAHVRVTTIPIPT